MRPIPWKWYFGLAVTLLLVGVVLPFFMVLGWLKSTFLLNFVAYGSSVSGLFVGFWGILGYLVEKRRR
ncbi:hypothetical protein D6833_11505 [Candidatus Parcubacteria bacterium]|nr:MAG: hypothetical protein D6833_11505 [Candidatus Parcubacteria bacterium]